MSEVWMPIPGYEGLYEASDHGRIRSIGKEVLLPNGGRRLQPGRVLRPAANSRGYLLVTLHKNRRQATPAVHQLVMLAFVGAPPPGLVVCHGTAGKTDNSLANLTYGTPTQNQADRKRDGTSKIGDEHPGARLTKEQAQWALSMKGVMTQMEIAKKLAVSNGQISKIHSGRAWRHIHPPAQP